MTAQKAELRDRCLDRRRRLAKVQVFQASTAIRKRLLDLKDYREAGVLHTYVSREEEVDTIEIMRMTLGSGCRVVVPIVEPGRPDLRHAEIRDLDELATGPFGLRQPSVETARWVEEGEHFDLILVPGVAFDARGRRLGHGRAYYDRFLAGTSALRVGLIQSTFLVDAVPVEAHDVAMNVVLTDTNTYIGEPDDLRTEDLPVSSG